eukprot:11473958-Ditylum_brightwellii.AAC.1
MGGSTQGLKWQLGKEERDKTNRELVSDYNMLNFHALQASFYLEHATILDSEATLHCFNGKINLLIITYLPDPIRVPCATVASMKVTTGGRISIPEFPPAAT